MLCEALITDIYYPDFMSGKANTGNKYQCVTGNWDPGGAINS